MKTTGDEIDQLGNDIYETRLQALLETEENIGKIVSIDVLSGDYEIANDLLVSELRLRELHPDAEMNGKRIGYNAVYALGGAQIRTAAGRF